MTSLLTRCIELAASLMKSQWLIFAINPLKLEVNNSYLRPIFTNIRFSDCRKFDRRGDLWPFPPSAPNPALLNGSGPPPTPSIPARRSSRIARVAMALPMLVLGKSFLLCENLAYPCG